MRSKEEAHDYRYFPEPDLVPLVIDEAWKTRIEENLPELPREKQIRWKEEFDLPEYDIGVLTEDKTIADYFELTVEEYDNPKEVSNWMMSELFRVLKRPEADLEDVDPEDFAYLVELVGEEEINDNTAKDVLERSFKEGKSPKEIVEAEGLKRISDEVALTEKIDEVIEENPDAVEDFKSGNEKVLGFLIGQLMSKTQGQADPNKAREILKERNLEYSYFSMSNQGFFYRSDQFSFARRGIPSVWLSAGEDYTGGVNRLREFFLGNYHTVDDEFDPGWKLESTLQTVEVTLDLINYLNSRNQALEWKGRMTFPVEK